MAWINEEALPFTVTTSVYFSPIVSDVVYILDRGTEFWKYNLTTKIYTKLTSPTYSGENVYRTLAISPDGTKIAVVSEGAASEPNGRRIEIFTISSNSWTASSQAPDILGSTSALRSVVWEDNDIIWAWSKRTAVNLGKCIKWVSSTNTWTQYTNDTVTQNKMTGSHAARKEDG